MIESSEEFSWIEGVTSRFDDDSADGGAGRSEMVGWVASTGGTAGV